MDDEFLSKIELYYSEPERFAGDLVTISGDEYRHITRVMRHKIGDEIFVTNGLGKIFNTELLSISKSVAELKIIKEFQYENKFHNIIFCIPKLKNPDRFEFALEKSVELGITNFIIYNSRRAVAKGSKIDRWNKVVLSAMKQSLRSFLPVINEAKNLDEIVRLNGEIILFEQNSGNNISDLKMSNTKNYYFIFGPEGGLDQEELSLVNKKRIYHLAENRLRSETAVITFAAMLPAMF